ncbi:P22 phage major capsid protein family protein [Verrucomicrobium sp. BvORR106]|uniref:P22 phage major capsid protein family protein n=1 Tax=Verrucomicrobium sp. BvORR106 TaxID=1403819 RepID=UPI00057026AB|nr:P22 phage major capsid protein family protein [Verrucomicrobium sp. BvORR106]
MPNDIASAVNITRISQLTLDALVTQGVPLRAFLTDFSDELEPHGETVTARFPGALTTQDMNASKAPGSVTFTPVPITLDNFRGVVMGFKDTERTFTDVKLAEEFVQPAVSALVDYVISAALSVVTNANGYTHAVTLTSAQFDADAVADLADEFSTRKIPTTGRVLLIKPKYKGSLVKDNAIQNASASGSNGAVVNNEIPRVHGFAVVEYNGTIPANGEALEGIAVHPQAICMAARGVVPPPADTWYGKVVNIIEPNTGLPLQIREYYDGVQLVYEIAVLFGVAKGMPAKLTRIKSA